MVGSTGNGTFGFSGDGGPSTSAQLNDPYGVAVDAGGNLYIADTFNARIRKVTPAGVITTVAGNGTFDYAGDGGPATSTSLNPWGVAVDAAGNLYIADYSNMRIRKVTPAGVITTVAGNGTLGFSGDGGPATSARLYNPYGVAVDAAGNLYVADYGNRRIRKVTSSGVITTVAGNGSQGYSGDGGPATSAQLNDPYGVAVDAAGNLYIADNGNMRIRKVTPAGVITTVAGNGTLGFGGDGGPATSANLARPQGVAVDTTGNLYIADTENARIRKVTPAGVITTVAGKGIAGFSGDGGLATSAQLNNPRGVAVDAMGNLYIADTSNMRVRKVAAAGAGVLSYFPQVAVGNGFSTTFTLGNTGATAVSGTLLLTDQQGNPFPVNSPSFGPGSSFPVSIPPGGTTFLTVTSLAANDPQKSGWATIETTGGLLSGVATYQLVAQGVLQTAAGVLQSQPIQFATIPVDNDDSENRFTGYALANPSDQSLLVKLGVVDQDGNLVDDAVTIPLGPRQQIARFLHQDVNRLKFKGSMVLRAQAGGSFVVVALVQNQQIYTVVPVTPGKAPHIPN